MSHPVTTRKDEGMNRKFVAIKHSMIEVGPTLMRKFLVDLHNAYILRDELDSAIDEYLRSGKATILPDAVTPDTRKEEEMTEKSEDQAKEALGKIGDGPKEKE